MSLGCRQHLPESQSTRSHPGAMEERHVSAESDANKFCDVAGLASRIRDVALAWSRLSFKSKCVTQTRTRDGSPAYIFHEVDGARDVPRISEMGPDPALARRILLSNLCEDVTLFLYTYLRDALSRGRRLFLNSRRHGMLELNELFIVQALGLARKNPIRVIRTRDVKGLRSLNKTGAVSIKPSDQKTLGIPPGHVWVAGSTPCGKIVNIDPTIEQFDVSAVGRAAPCIWVGDSPDDIGVENFVVADIVAYHSSTPKVNEMLRDWTYMAQAVDERGLNPLPLLPTLKQLIVRK